MTLRRAYQRVRGSARGYVEAAAPGIAGLIDAHTPPVAGPVGLTRSGCQEAAS